MRLLVRLALLPFASCIGSTDLLLAQTPLHVFHGDSAGDEFGVSVALVGDANRDGYADVLVGAHWDDNNGNNSGSARLFSGVDGTILATFNGDASNDFFGLAVADLGDVNGDGYDDFAVGADGSNMGGVDAGLVRVFSGKTSAALRNIPGTFPGEQLGDALAGVRDASGSVLIGAPFADTLGVDAGLAQVVSTMDGAILWTFSGAAPDDQFGTSVASGMDVNGDAIPDFLIGAPNDDVGGIDSGSVSAYSGATGNLIRTWRGYSPGDRFGTSVALIPDVDGDGRAEVVIGAPRADGPGADAGAVYVYSGSSGSLFFSRVGESSGDQFGSSVANVSTRTGNPEPLFVAGARLNDVAGNNAGASYVYSALSGGLVQVLRGHAPGDWFGGAVAGGADVNGDGLGDLVVSARLADVNGSDSGSVEAHSSPLVPSTWYVDVAAPWPGTGTQNSPYHSIQYAINRSTTRSGDTIMIAAGTYFENVVIDSKVLRLAKNGVDRPVIDGQQQGPVISILGNSGPGTSLIGLKIRNGEMVNPDPNSPDDWYGAGVYSPNSCLEIIDSVITDNITQNVGRLHGIGAYVGGIRIRIANCEIAYNGAVGGNSGSSDSGGGGVNANGAFIEIVDSLIKGNYSEMNGGGISAFGGDVLIRGCSIIDNNTGQAGDDGGGLLAGGDVVLIESCDISRNTSRDNGAGISVTGQATIRNCLIDGNRCGEGSYEGGGVYAVGPGTTIESCVISHNRNAHGAGTSGPVFVQDTTFYGNSAESGYDPYYCGRGAAMHGGTALRCLVDSNNFGIASSSFCPGSAAADATLIQCTIVNNAAPNQPGDYGSTLESCTLDSCIIWSNHGELGNALTSASYSDIEGGLPGPGNIAVDPLFLVPGHNFHLTSVSPCIDSGNPALPLDPNGTRADMGAFPYDPNYCPPPFVYCTAKTNSCGQLPVISFTGSPHAGAASGFVITASRARAGRSGLLLYSPNGTASSPFQGGTLCIAPQGLRRGPAVLASGGTGGAFCDAIFTIDWAAFGAGNLGGNPQPFLNTLGQRVNVQWWGRDNLVIGSFLSNAIQYEVCP